ncbi:hypothetical protein ACIRU3_41485 [Streptomyces sp. NPDC101151]|uniref:hypothetical protein n=1 Tax=Streptomyces sp. NPDC101151 TaxID=3366115 RepID=UPI0038064046
MTICTAYRDYFAKLAGQDRAHWQYSTTTGSPYKACFFPSLADDPSPGDTITGGLGNVTCTYTEGGTTRHTKVRVGMFKLTRLPMAQKPVTLKTAGCMADIVHSQTGSGSSSGTWETLRASPPAMGHW